MSQKYEPVTPEYRKGKPENIAMGYDPKAANNQDLEEAKRRWARNLPARERKYRLANRLYIFLSLMLIMAPLLVCVLMFLLEYSATMIIIGTLVAVAAISFIYLTFAPILRRNS